MTTATYYQHACSTEEAAVEVAAAVGESGGGETRGGEQAQVEVLVERTGELAELLICPRLPVQQGVAELRAVGRAVQVRVQGLGTGGLVDWGQGRLRYALR